VFAAKFGNASGQWLTKATANVIVAFKKIQFKWAMWGVSFELDR